ncbi:MAG: type II toxin-antitoxin system VapC family toxin [Rhizobium sp.]
MIAYLLHTNAVIALLGRKSDALVNRVLATEQGRIGLSAVVMHELYFGAQKSTKVAHNLETLRLLVADLPILEFDRNDAFVSGEIRASLAAKGTPIGPYDVLIAGQARARELVLITNNTGEFNRVAGLSVEDWTQST